MTVLLLHSQFSPKHSQSTPHIFLCLLQAQSVPMSQSVLYILSVQLLGYVQYHVMIDLYNNMSCLICTITCYDWLVQSHISPLRERYVMYFVGSNCDLYAASVTAAMYAISCYVGPRYNGT